MDMNWKTDNYKFVGAAFDYAYANRLNKLTSIIGTVSSNSIDYELTGSGGALRKIAPRLHWRGWPRSRTFPRLVSCAPASSGGG